MNFRRAKLQKQRDLVIGLFLLALLFFAGFGLLTVNTSGDYRPIDRKEWVLLEQNTSPISCAVFSIDGNCAATGSEDGSVRLWHPLKHTQLSRQPKKHPAPITSVVFSPDSSRIASGDRKGQLRIWDIGKARQIAQLSDRKQAVTCMSFYPAGQQIIAGYQNGEVLVWDTKNQTIDRRFLAHQGKVSGIAVLPNRQHLLSAGADGKLVLRVLASGKILKEINQDQAALSLSVSLNGEQAVTVHQDGTTIMWDVMNGKQLHQWTALKNDDTLVQQVSLCLSPGAGRLLTGGVDGILRLWHRDQVDSLLEFAGHKDTVTCCAFYPSGSVGLSGSLDGTIRLWHLGTPDTTEKKQIIVARKLAKKQIQALARFQEHLESGNQQLAEINLDSLAFPAALEFDESQLNSIIEHFLKAQQEVTPGSLEFDKAATLIATIESKQREIQELKEANTSKIERFTAFCKAGENALSEGNLNLAVEKFTAAEQIFPQHQDALDGLRRVDATRLSQEAKLQEAIKPTNVKISNLDIAWDYEPPTQGLLKQSRNFAFLLVGKNNDPPVALLSSPLRWKMKINTLAGISRSRVRLRVTLLKDSTTFATETFAFESDSRNHSFSGIVEAPSIGWDSGEYQLQVSLILREVVQTLDQSPTFSVGLVKWRREALEVAPEDVFDSNFALQSDIRLNDGDAYFIRAGGEITLTDRQVYRLLLDDASLKTAPAAGPQGIQGSQNSRLGLKYQLLQPEHRFAALLMRRGNENWAGYRPQTSLELSKSDQPISFSINLINRKRTRAGAAFIEIKSNEKSLWRSKSGPFHVEFFIGTFEFPITLNQQTKTTILDRFQFNAKTKPQSQHGKSGAPANNYPETATPNRPPPRQPGT